MKNLLLLVISLCLSTLLFANDDYEIQLKSGKFTPKVTTDFAKAVEPLLAEKNQISVYRLIQFYDIPTEKEKQAIRNAGVELISYIPNKAYLCEVKNNASSNAFETLNIRSVFPIKGEYKMEKNIARGNFPKWAVSGDYVKVNIKYFSKEDKEKVVETIENDGGVVLEQLETINTLLIQFLSENINDLSENPMIQWIEAVAPAPTPDDLEGHTSSRANVLKSNYAGGRNYDGSGVVIALADQGRVGPHVDFEGRLTNHTTRKTGNHGDMTSGIFAGAGNIDPNVEGMASGADLNIYFVEPLLSLGINSYPHIANGVDHLNNLGTVITSTSYSQGEGGVYTSDCEFVDNQIDANQSLMHVFSAGNSGTRDHGYGAGAGWGNISGGTKSAKNVICVGNVDEDNTIFTTSSRGPAKDGRIKPDICAKGQGHRSTDENNSFQNGSGTSAATPLIAGVITQLHQAYKVHNGGTQPESALLKASILNTATDINNPGPDYSTGWGSVNALKAVRIIEDERYVRSSIEQGESTSHTITVPDNVAQVRIMTYWSDAGGSPAAAKALVNDINMQVADPSGTNYDPWVLDPTPNVASLTAPATRGVDNINNVEQVTIDNPASGDYVVNLSGFEIPQGPQTYYVVYDFIFEGVELIYPIGGEGLVPGERENITWDASPSSEVFMLEYSQDGGNTYTLITNSVSSTERSFEWSVPPVISNDVKVRVSRGNSQSESIESFTLAPVPQNFIIAAVCPDSIELTWNPVNNVGMYEISQLGDKYMDSIGVSTTGSFKIGGLNVNEGHWFSVRSVIDGAKGRRAIAIFQSPGTQNCILNTDVGIAEIVYPPSGVISNCRDLGNTDILVDLSNFGLSDATDFEMNYQVNGGAVVSETFSSAIAPGENSVFTFNQKADLSITGVYNISVWCIFDSDENFFNDTINTTVKVVNGASIASLPHTETFQSFNTCSTSPTCEAINCQLGNGWINFDNNIDDDIDWRTDAGGTTTSNTGPPSDFDMGTAAGQYLYLEGTEGCNFREAVLISPCIDLTNSGCAEFTFAYHMFGVNIGELHVDLITKNGVIKDVIPPFIGAQGNFWNFASVDLSAYQGDIVNARFRGSIGNGTRADMAIDAFNVMALPAPVADFTFSSGSGNSFNFTDNSSGDVTSYLWDFGDGNISTNQNPTHTYADSDIYDVTLTITGPCGQDVTVISTSGMSNTVSIELASKIEIHPNPTAGNFMIELPSQLAKQNMDIKIVDVIGKTVLDIGTIKNQEQISVNAGTLADGVYFVKMAGEDFRISRRMVKQ